ncbi:MAG: DNA-directed RNA polymerase subunit N [Candidatus Diapherotrites archaeon]|nr:DNA-directed RNA polymerase subunit N [Candidatus Diapherotrites archaeon]
MIVPVRCFSCGKVVGDAYEKLVKEVKNGKKAETALDELGIKRYCCRRMLLSHVDLMDEIMRYGK